MDDKDRKVDADAAEFTTESRWRIGGDSDNVYFFGNDRDSSILSDFGWNLHPNTAEHSGGELDRIGSEILAGNCDSAGVSGGAEAEVEASARQGGPVSTSSSDDPPEKSSASVGDSVAKPSSDIAFKVKKKGEKRIKQPRFAFMTKSEVDHLEDGYRWRKYGQKAVKNSPFPRSYYRCTNSKCTVKKRVERSCEDPTIVITTYEGQHCHHSVGFPRGGALINHEAAFPNHLAPSALRFSYPIVSFPQESSLENLQSHQVPRRESGTSGFLPEPTPQPPIAEGLLGDIVPGMRNRGI